MREAHYTYIRAVMIIVGLLNCAHVSPTWLTTYYPQRHSSVKFQIERDSKTISLEPTRWDCKLFPAQLPVLG